MLKTSVRSFQARSSRRGYVQRALGQADAFDDQPRRLGVGAAVGRVVLRQAVDGADPDVAAPIAEKAVGVGLPVGQTVVRGEGLDLVIGEKAEDAARRVDPDCPFPVLADVEDMVVGEAGAVVEQPPVAVGFQHRQSGVAARPQAAAAVFEDGGDVDALRQRTGRSEEGQCLAVAGIYRTLLTSQTPPRWRRVRRETVVKGSPLGVLFQPRQRPCAVAPGQPAAAPFPAAP